MIPYLRTRGHEVAGVDLEVDIRKPGPIDIRVAEFAPTAIIHAAAWTDVDRAESNEAAAAAVNADGARNVARAAARAGAALVCVSTDYVFDGTSDRDYTEDDPASPIGAYGRTKRAGEIASLEEYPGGVRIARTAWLYGAHGGNFVDTMLRLGTEREVVQVVADQLGSPTWTRDLAPALEALIDLPPGVYHTTGGGSVTWRALPRRSSPRPASIAGSSTSLPQSSGAWRRARPARCSPSPGQVPPAAELARGAGN